MPLIGIVCWTFSVGLGVLSPHNIYTDGTEAKTEESVCVCVYMYMFQRVSDVTYLDFLILYQLINQNLSTKSINRNKTKKGTVSFIEIDKNNSWNNSKKSS